jgi:GH25 family lysozyme M1 (1,4-beta-N-acetylmuramidase)
MKFSYVLAVTTLTLVNAMPSDLEKRAQPKGFDVSGYQPNVNWNQVKTNGAEFVMIKVLFSLLSPTI